MPATNYGPDESAAQILAEKAWLQGEILQCVFWGMDFILFSQSAILLYRQIWRNALRQKLPLLIYICVLFALGTVFMVSTTAFTQFAFITNRNYPGGPAQVENDFFSIPIDEASNVAFVLANWLADVLIVWRCMVIYKGCRVPMWAILAFPVALYMGSIVTGSLFLRQISTSSVYNTITINWTIPYFSLSLALNILVTMAIVARLLVYRHRITRALGPAHGTQYASIAAMIVESAALYSSFSLLFLIPFALNSTISPIFLQALGNVQIFATLLIVMRVAQGRAWSSDQTTKLTTAKASERHPSGISARPVAMTKLSNLKFRTDDGLGGVTSSGGSTLAQASSFGVKIDHEVYQFSDGGKVDDAASESRAAAV